MFYFWGIVLLLLGGPATSKEVDLDFQHCDGYIYPEEKGGEHLEGPLSSKWVESKELID